MNDKSGKNIGASTRDRLLALARERGEDFQSVLTRYGLERLLYRLSRSDYRDHFILKGAMLFVLWSENVHRPTRDVDFLGLGDSSEAGLQEVFRELCDLAVDVKANGDLLLAMNRKLADIIDEEVGKDDGGFLPENKEGWAIERFDP
jgi:predicted nucleotidyltransferase component of viral defense system